METEKTTEAEITPELEGGGAEQVGEETVSVSKKDYDVLHQTLGSLKRELKDLKKPRESVQTESKPEAPALLQKSFLRAAGITAQEEVDLALTTAKKWGVEVDQLVDDEDFKVKLDRLRIQKSNEVATSNIKGGSGSQQTKNTSEYWIAKGTPPSAADVPDRKTRAKIARAMMANAKTGKTFYND